jgi:aldehyde dehydrogenase (NAD+)
MAGLLSENEAALQKAVAADFKTASQEFVFETAAPLGETQFQKSQLKAWMEPVEAPLPKFLAETGHKGFVYRDPYGVALIIGPFNGPLTLLIRPTLAALAAGNTCILKVSEQLSATSALLMDLIPRYFDPRAVSAVLGGREEVTELLKLPFDFIFFTGSTKVGKIVMRAAAENLTPVLLELGGQNPALVDETANIADAAKKIVWGAMAWGGQWCTSPGYAYVHEAVSDAFVAEAKKAVVDLYGPEPRTNPDYSRMISAREVSRLAGLIDPAKVVAGGRSDPDARRSHGTIRSWRMRYSVRSCRFLPTALWTKPSPASPPHPILSPLVFSRDQKTIDRFIGELSYGGGAVNQVNIHLFIESMPFGGTGAAGIGHYYGKYGFDMLTHAKSMLIAPPNVAIDHLFPPYTKQKNEALTLWFEY